MTKAKKDKILEWMEKDPLKFLPPNVLQAYEEAKTNYEKTSGERFQFLWEFCSYTPSEEEIMDNMPRFVMQYGSPKSKAVTLEFELSRSNITDTSKQDPDLKAIRQLEKIARAIFEAINVDKLASKDVRNVLKDYMTKHSREGLVKYLLYGFILPYSLEKEKGVKRILRTFSEAGFCTDSNGLIHNLQTSSELYGSEGISTFVEEIRQSGNIDLLEVIERFEKN